MDENSKFSRALKNPVVVLGLCVIAGLAVYQNLVDTTPDFIPHSLKEAAAPFLGETLTASTPSLQGHDAEANQWINNPPRDPFAPVPTWTKAASSGQPRSSSSGIEGRQLGALPQFELKAIALENQERSAVINRSIVYEGEMIDGYQVVAIELQGVWLKRRGKKHLLTFKAQTTS